MSNKLEGKIALVTGGSRGIGAAIAKRLAADGATIAITYARDAEGAAAVVKAIEGGGGNAIAIQADATDAAAVKAAVDKTVASLGRLDVLVNNAGTAIPKKFEETTLEEFDRVIDINLRGVFVTTQAALKHMKDGGRIITIGSCVGERMMTPGLVAYSATKGAIRMFTQGLSREVGSRGIKSLTAAKTPMSMDSILEVRPLYCSEHLPNFCHKPPQAHHIMAVGLGTPLHYSRCCAVILGSSR